MPLFRRQSAEDAHRIPRKDRTGVSPVKAGAVLIVAALLITYFGFTKHIPFTHGYRLNAAFQNAVNIKSGPPVRIAGVNVGKVMGVDKAGGGDASEVKMELPNKALPLHKDATMKIRPRIFLEGNFFVDLHPGTPASPEMQNGDTLPIQQASAPVQLDQVLSALNSNVRTDLQTLIKEYGQAINEGGDAYRRSQQYWAPAYKYSAMVNDAA